MCFLLLNQPKLHVSMLFGIPDYTPWDSYRTYDAIPRTVIGIKRQKWEKTFIWAYAATPEPTIQHPLGANGV